jgi:hypothetical protein
MAITYTNTTEQTKYYIIHSEPKPGCGTCSIVMLLELEPGSSVGTGQPYSEQFPTHEEALARAIELGYEVPEVPEVPEAF